MKPVNAEDNPGLAKLPTEVRNKMGYMKKGGMTKHPMKKGSKRMKKFEDGGYTGNDEIVQYRMGQIKDPGIDLFKLVQGEEQVAKPVAKSRSMAPEAKSEPKVEYKENIVETEADLNPYGVGKGTTTAKKQTFGEAFKSARAGGGKTFTYNGKSYTTELAKPSSAKPAAKPVAKADDVKPAKTETKKPYDSNAANASIKAQAKLDSEYTPPKPPSSPGRLGFKGEFFSGKPYGAEKFEKEQRSKKSMAAEGSYKKGGSVSSASKRADGCAMRGKTRA
jgi:hypothetical protein